VGSDVRPNHIHGIHEGLVASSDVEWTILGPTRYMTNFAFDWPPVLNDGLLLESGGSGAVTCIDPDDVAEIAAKVLIEDGHDGQTYRISSEDSFTAVELAALLSEVVGRDVHVVEGVAPAGYFGLVAAGLYFPTDTAAKLLGRSPRAYREWLDDHPPPAAAVSRSSQQ
jgi:uncharacterized protein YbjT (DUF2867 family)